MITKMMSKPESLCSELPAYILHPQPHFWQINKPKTEEKKKI